VKLKVDFAQTLASIDKVAAKQSRAVSRAIKVAGMEFSDKLQNALSRGNSRYRKYQRRGTVHWSSRPNRSPNPDTGWLKRSVSLSRRRTQGSVFVVVSAKYAKALEFGTRDKRIAPRPFVRPLAKALRPKFRRDLIKALNRVR
jgi:HK97 gp10 family phage protein